MIAANNQPQIYYVVQGSETQNKNACIDKTFIDSQPLIARKKAFDFLDFYYSAKNESRELETEEETNGIRSNFYLDELNEYSIQIKEKDITSNGIGLYIVVSGFIQNANQTIQKEDKFLLFTDINSTKETIKEMIKGLFREFGLFQYLNIPILEYKLEMGYQFGELLDNPRENYFILRTPFDFKRASFKLFLDRSFNNKILYLLNKNNHLMSSFINELNWHRIRIHISSFLNSKSGYIFLGNIRNTDVISSIFQDKSIVKIKALLNEEIVSYFIEHKEYISFEFISINNALISIIKVKTNKLKPCLYTINTENKFSYRTQIGIVSTIKIPEIITHLSHFFSNKSQIKNIIDSL